MGNGKDNERGELVKLTGLWINEGRDGKMFLSGYLGDASVFIFRNNFKEEGTNQPDYNLYVSRRKKKDKDRPETDKNLRDPLREDQEKRDYSPEALDKEIPF